MEPSAQSILFKTKLNSSLLGLLKREYIFRYIFIIAGSIATAVAVFVLGKTLTFDPRSRASMNLSTVPLSEISYKIERVIGQPDAKNTMNNRIVDNRGFGAGGVHVDSQGRIYVFDSNNNRVLGFSSYTPNRNADIVIGQPSLFDSGLANGDNTKYLMPSASTLALVPYPNVPSTQEGGREGQMATDTNNNLYVLDYNNNRILKYNSPFTTDTVADDVWGQSDFVSRQSYCGQEGFPPNNRSLCLETGNQFNNTIHIIYMAGVDIDLQGNIWVTDTGNHRVLRFPQNSKTADLVLGQPDFVSNQARNSYDMDLNRMNKPIAIKIDKQTGSVYVIESEKAGAARILVFNPPFTNGMNANREIGRADFQNEEPVDKTNWENIDGKWVHVTTGLYWPRGFVFDPVSSGGGLWVNDLGNTRVARLASDTGNIIEVIGQPDDDTRGCFGWPGQGYIDYIGEKQNLCHGVGEIGIDADNNVFVSSQGANDPRYIIRFPLPIQRDAEGLAVSNGWLMHEGFNQISGKTVENAYGMSLTNTSTAISQMFVSDNQRVLVWNNPLRIATFTHANYVIGQDTFDQNKNNNGGIFSGVWVNNQTVGGGYLWVGANDRIFVFKLPINHSGKDYQPVKILTQGDSANVRWADDNTPVSYSVSGLLYDEQSRALWISDGLNNRILRINDPIGDARVNLVLGQENKTSTCDNACMDGPNEFGFGSPWTLVFDNYKNLYVVDSTYEGWCCGTNNRVLRFRAQDITPTANIFPFPAANGVYTKPSFSSDKGDNWGPHTPATPTYVAFDSLNRMLMLTDSYGNNQYERAYMYAPNHTMQTFPQPNEVLPIPFGQGAIAKFIDDTHLVIQDHTWSRIMFVTILHTNMIPSDSTLLTPETQR